MQVEVGIIGMFILITNFTLEKNPFVDGASSRYAHHRRKQTMKTLIFSFHSSHAKSSSIKEAASRKHASRCPTINSSQINETALVADVGANLIVTTSILTVDLGLSLRTTGTLKVASLVQLAGRRVDVAALAQRNVSVVS